MYGIKKAAILHLRRNATLVYQFYFNDYTNITVLNVYHWSEFLCKCTHFIYSSSKIMYAHLSVLFLDASAKSR